MDILKFELPWPPSINHYYLQSSSGVILGEKGKRYRKKVSLLLHSYKGSFGDEKRLKVTIHAFPPDKRRRDIDNICKATLDALEHAQVFKNDNQVDVLTVIRREVIKEGCLQIWIAECS